MKSIRTRLGYEEVVVDGKTEDDDRILITREAQVVSNEEAERLEKAANRVGVELKVEDYVEGEDGAEGGNPAPRVVQTPDLSAGVSAVSGQGAPVSTPGATDDSTDTSKAGRSGSSSTGRNN